MADSAYFVTVFPFILCFIRNMVTQVVKQHVDPPSPAPATPKVKQVAVAAAVITRPDGSFLLGQRGGDTVYSGYWEFPGGKQEPGETLEETVRREISEELEINVAVGEKIATVKHAYTHFKITLHAYYCDWQAGKPNPKAAQDWHWVAPEALPGFALPKANKTVLEMLL